MASSLLRMLYMLMNLVSSLGIIRSLLDISAYKIVHSKSYQIISYLAIGFSNGYIRPAFSCSLNQLVGFLTDLALHRPTSTYRSIHGLQAAQASSPPVAKIKINTTASSFRESRSSTADPSANLL